MACQAARYATRWQVSSEIAMNAALMLNCDSFFAAKRTQRVQYHRNINKFLQNSPFDWLQIAQSGENHAQSR